MTTSNDEPHDEHLARVTDLSAWRLTPASAPANSAAGERGSREARERGDGETEPAGAEATTCSTLSEEPGPSAGSGEPRAQAAPSVTAVFGAGDSRRGPGAGPSADTAERFIARQVDRRREEVAAPAAAAESEPHPGLLRVPSPTRGERATTPGDDPAARQPNAIRDARARAARASTDRRDVEAADGEAPLTLTTEEAVEAAEHRILRRLRRADRSREELRRELASDDLLDDESVEGLLDRLADLGYVDDVRMAETLADKLLDRKGKGIEGVRRELRHRLLDDDVIAEALEGRERDDEFNRAASLAASRAERLRGHDRDTAMRRLMGFLQRRGFGSGVALIAANDALDALDRPGTPGPTRGTARPGVSGVYFGNADE
ncbi:hypothetical protein GCM10011490_26370 [Pseudoclavibacter endophyticus]|nr:regulatory protein RecX [Pseudoclavibacter endophyticus]GGA74405.1 hypothetical protein GCM10011490_26370 [Pseudoclavibacter endophyticus]